MNNQSNGDYFHGRDALGARHMQMLRRAPRGDVLAWMACGCIVAADSFASGLSQWEGSGWGAKAFGIDGVEGTGNHGVGLRLTSTACL
jgi:hypothetical protein